MTIIRTPQGDRRLTITECERLQGFPDGWTVGSDTQRFKQCGNAVTVNVVRDVALKLYEGDSSMIWSNTPHPHRCDCKVITEAQEKAGVVCGMHTPGPHGYVEEPRSLWA